MMDLSHLPLPQGITSRILPTGTGLDMHVLEAGDPDAPLMLLLHGFPELAYSWRRVMLPLAGAGFRVVAPDLRGYGRTTGWDARYEGDFRAFALPNIVRDLLGLLRALGRDSVACTVGHDFGSPLTAWAALLRPDVFGRVVLMSAPFGGPPALEAPDRNPDPGLLALPRPRKHYQWYYSTPEANRDMLEAPQGLPAFLRAYFHMKSADWPANRPEPLSGWTAEALARLPGYYVMQAGEGMAATVAPEMPDADTIAACAWLPKEDLAVFAAEYGRTGFQGGLNWYRCATAPDCTRDLAVFAGKRIEVPVTFIAGASDWGYRQVAGALEAMETTACADYRGTYLVPGAGHWVQQEQPGETVRLILDFAR
ncbi:alpha/beta hydrolase [Rhodobacteraceae bacterium NNCM2]|nr:alpha/beta hydrolase [Coraliihabitans acroporae]